jgi:hypothetical protein
MLTAGVTLFLLLSKATVLGNGHCTALGTWVSFVALLVHWL